MQLTRPAKEISHLHVHLSSAVNPSIPKARNPQPTKSRGIGLKAEAFVVTSVPEAVRQVQKVQGDAWRRAGAISGKAGDLGWNVTCLA